MFALPAKECAKKLKVLAVEHRMAIVKSLQSGDKTVSQICLELGIEQSLVSHHLGKLKEIGLLTCRKSGLFKIYSLSHSSEHNSLDLGCCRLKF